MAYRLLINNAKIVNEDNVFDADIIIEDKFISEIIPSGKSTNYGRIDENFNASGLLVFPGFIDTHVHFREPGLTHKADIFSESRAAAAGGITSFMEMPNTKPPSTSKELINQKFDIAEKNSLVNYSFFAGATNQNAEELLKLDFSKIGGIKVFMGSSTGNMLVDDEKTLNTIFANSPVTIAVHCESENIIKNQTEKFKNLYGENPPFSVHEQIRNAEACLQSTTCAVELAKQTGAKLHVTHISTKEELNLFDSSKPLKDKKITAEAVVPHLWFCSDDYQKLGARIKCNPSIKNVENRNALRNALNINIIDSIATDHAPHLLEEKNNTYYKCPSGMPSVQFSSAVVLELVKQNIITLETMAQKMCHAPATIFNIEKRGFIRQGYYADLAFINPEKSRTVTDQNVISKCKWTPFDGTTFSSTVEATMVNGKFVFLNNKIIETNCAEYLTFKHK